MVWDNDYTTMEVSIRRKIESLLSHEQDLASDLITEHSTATLVGVLHIHILWTVASECHGVT